MALGVTSLGSVGNTANQSSYTVPVSRAPADETLVLVSVLVSDTAGTPVQPTGVVGTGLTFSLATSSVTFDTIASAIHNLSLWRGMGTGLDSSVVTATFPNTATGCALLVTEVSGVSKAGVNGANAVGGSATSRLDGVGAPSAITLFFPSAASTANGWFSCHGHSTSGEPSLTENWTFSDTSGYLTPSTGIASAWTSLSGGTVLKWFSAGNENRGAIGIELVLDNPAVVSVTTTPFRRPLRIPPVPSGVTGPLADWCRLAASQLNQEGYISLFSGTNPNTSGFTGLPGNILVNIGSDSTTTRLWTMGGGITSIDTNDWHPVRVA